MLRADVEARHNPRLCNRDTGVRRHDLRLPLVHGKCRSEHAGMGIRDLQVFEDALDGAILTEGAVERVEGDVRPQLREHLTDIATDVDLDDAVALAFQCLGACIPRRQAHRPLRRKTTHQDSYMLATHLRPRLRKTEHC